MTHGKSILACLLYGVASLILLAAHNQAKAQTTDTDNGKTSITRASNHQSSTTTDFKTASATTLILAKDAAGPVNTLAAVAQTAPRCNNIIKADVAAIAQPYMLNRLGAAMPEALIFALADDVDQKTLLLKSYKRPRPIVLRANVGDCLQVTLTNLVYQYAGKPAPTPTPTPRPTPTTPTPTPTPIPLPTTTRVSLHVQGMQLVDSIASDGSFVGVNNSSLANSPQCQDPNNPGGTIPCVNKPGDLPPTPISPGEKRVYTLYAQAEGTFLLYSLGDSDTNGQQIEQGLFGSVNVQPSGAEWYRSQVTANDLGLATKGTSPGGQPYLDYIKRYPADYPIDSRRCVPILRMADDEYQVQNGQCVKVSPDTRGLSPFAGRVLKLYHSDLTAVITGPNQGPFPGTTGVGNPEPPCNLANDPNNRTPVDPLFCTNPSLPDRKQPYREVTTIYHEVAGAAQAFAELNSSSSTAATTASGQDAFAINYGTGGIGAEILANRKQLGPMANCIDCKYEEFFLSSWSVGDPAMVVDLPANAGKATKAFYPDDPSNVYHSYLNDHVKFRILHGGIGVTHVHHQHAAQWLQSPNSDQSNYLDSQMISPGASYTLEMVYNGSGNLNKTAGDSIFHCHFYPHFAAGMWAHWRSHDVFEAGTQLDSDGRPVATGWNRALPDGEIAGGLPTPAIIPLPAMPMAPIPARVKICTVSSANYDPNKVYSDCPALPLRQPGASTVPPPVLYQAAVINQDDLSRGLSPGFPFFIPGLAGARAPHPPFDFAPDESGGGTQASYLDGGLPRHLIMGGSVINQQMTAFDWSKDVGKLNAVQLPEDGTAAEKAAMKFFGTRSHASFTQAGATGDFFTNGLPRKPSLGFPAVNEFGSQRGAPFADPGVDLSGNVAGGLTPRIYKGAAFQMDVQLNNKGWHFPQQRLTSLWEDVVPTTNKQRTPEPLFFRANSGDTVEYWHTNLVPNYYLVDDYQVRTPTDIIGQHIHLVKFDVLSSDGAANGFNYEDGTFSPGEVQEIIHGINDGGKWTSLPGGPTRLTPKLPPPAILNCQANPNDPRCKPCATGDANCQSWIGAQTTVQRWYVDPILDNRGMDRTVGTVFTHDHFGPSTHQQAGLYAGLLAEPRSSRWMSVDGTQTFGNRADGGPTSWQANILTADPGDSFREFALEFQDFQLAYTTAAANPQPYPSPDPSRGYRLRGTSAQNNLLGNAVPSTPQLISSGATPSGAFIGTFSLNYRNAPISFRINPGQDLSYAFDSTFKMVSNLPPNGDPGTPLMRAYKNDKVVVRTLVGAHQLAHFFNIRGISWLAEPEWKNSGFKSSQAMGLSEYFQLKFRVPPSSAQTVKPCPDTLTNPNSTCNLADYLYVASSGDMGIANGLWGIFRAYDTTAQAASLAALPNNPVAATNTTTYATCPSGAPIRQFNITATTAKQALPNGVLTLNKRMNLTNPLGLMYVRTEDLNQFGNLNSTAPVEPLVLRVAAGECVRVTLTNSISAQAKVLQQPYQLQAPFDSAAYELKPSPKVGLHPELLAYDVTKSDGVNVGYNTSKNQVASIPKSGKPVPVTYEWYAGAIERNTDGTLKYTPIEFGAANLFPSDPLLQHINSLYGAVIVEPKESSWKCDGPPDANGYPTQVDCWPSQPATTTVVSRASATVTPRNGVPFRDFVVMMTEDIKQGTPPQTISAVNYKTEPVYKRFGNTNPSTFAANGDNSCSLSNTLLLAGKDPNTTPILSGDPETPIFTAKAGTPVRFRMLHPPGTGIAQVFTLNGHLWQRNPYTNDSTQIGLNPLSQWVGSLDSLGSTTHYDLVIDSAGGQFAVPGDYLYTAFVPSKAQFGLWGMFRVRDKDGKVVTGRPSYGQMVNGLPLCSSTQPARRDLAPAAPTPDKLEKFRPQSGTKDKNQ